MRRRNEQNEFGPRGSDSPRQDRFRFSEDRDERWSRPTNFERYDRVNRSGRFDRINRNERFGQDDRFGRNEETYTNSDYRAVGDLDSSDGYDREDRGGFFGKGPKGWKRPPERIRDEVCEVLWRNPRVDASEIEVTVEDNCVCLRGTVENRQAKREAESSIEHLSGVEDVRNEIRVKREAGTREDSRESNLRGFNKTANLS